MLFVESAAPKREIYIPPAPPEDEESIFATITTGINFDKYDEISVEVTGRDPPRNITTFEECGFFDTTQKNIDKCKYTRPTPVQKYAIPIVMQGRDLMACAQTGSGKTVSLCSLREWVYASCSLREWVYASCSLREWVFQLFSQGMGMPAVPSGNGFMPAVLSGNGFEHTTYTKGGVNQLSYICNTH